MTVQKLFPIFTNVFISSGTNFFPKTIKFLNFAWSFVQTQEILMQKKLKNLVRLTYISHMYEIL